MPPPLSGMPVHTPSRALTPWPDVQSSAHRSPRCVSLCAQAGRCPAPIPFESTHTPRRFWTYSCTARRAAPLHHAHHHLNAVLAVQLPLSEDPPLELSLLHFLLPPGLSLSVPRTNRLFVGLRISAPTLKTSPCGATAHLHVSYKVAEPVCRGKETEGDARQPAKRPTDPVVQSPPKA